MFATVIDPALAFGLFWMVVSVAGAICIGTCSKG